MTESVKKPANNSMESLVNNASTALFDLYYNYRASISSNTSLSILDKQRAFELFVTGIIIPAVFEEYGKLKAD